MKRYYKHIAVGIVLFLLFAGLLTNCMLNNIKDTDSILHDNYKHLSLVDGAIAWETGVIRRLYDFGQIFPVYKQDKRGRKIIENYEKLEQTSRLVRLIHAFFYRVPGSTGEADFGVTTQLAVDDLTAVKLVADIVAQCEQLSQQHSQFQAAVNYVQDLIAMIADAGWLNKLGPKVTRKNLEQKIKDVQEKPWNLQADNAFVSMCKSFAKNLAQDLGDEIMQTLAMHQQAAEKFFGVIAAVNKNLRDLFKSEVFKKREEVESFILQALHESDAQNPDVLYPPHTVEMILLAFVYKKYSYNRNLLKVFYDELNAQSDGKILVRDLDEQWVKESFAAVTQVEALNAIEQIFSAQDLMQSIKQHFAEFVYDTFQIRSFPAPVGYEKSSYEYEAGKKTALFADCMCNTMRNFINLYAYSAGQNKFTLEKLLANMNISQMHSSLVKFLKDFDSVNMASSQQAHDAWLTVISNIPYVAYNRMIDGSTGLSTGALETGKGYIAIPENERTDALLNWLKINRYQVVEKNQYGYELQPSIKNIIIVLDHLLQLNLFAEAGGLAKEFMRPDFIVIYFSKLCAAVKATGYLSTQKDAERGELNKDFDALDYTAFKIYVTFNVAKVTSEFMTCYGHGELALIRAEGLLEESKLRILLQRLSDFTGQPSLSLLVTNLLWKQQINFDYLTKSPGYLYINLFTVPLENTGSLRHIVYNVFKVVTNTTSLTIKMVIKDFLVRLAEKQPDVRQRQVVKREILKFIVANLNQNDCIYSVNLFNDATQAAVEGINDSDLDVRVLSQELFGALFDKDQAFDKAIEVAKKSMGDEVADVRARALGLFENLVKRNKAFKEAMEAAVEGFLPHQGKGVRIWALKLFRALVDKSQAFKEAAKAAENGLVSQDDDTKNMALDLFIALFSKSEGFAEAIQAAVKGFFSLDVEIGGQALALFKQLMINAPEETKQAVQKILDDPNRTLTEDEKQELDNVLKQYQ